MLALLGLVSRSEMLCAPFHGRLEYVRTYQFLSGNQCIRRGRAMSGEVQTALSVQSLPEGGGSISLILLLYSPRSTPVYRI